MPRFKKSVVKIEEFNCEYCGEGILECDDCGQMFEEDEKIFCSYGDVWQIKDEAEHICQKCKKERKVV